MAECGDNNSGLAIINANRAFLNAPRRYPGLAGAGLRWTKDGPYWIAFKETNAGPILTGIFHEAADIPNRL